MKVPHFLRVVVSVAVAGLLSQYGTQVVHIPGLVLPVQVTIAAVLHSIGDVMHANGQTWWPM